RVELVTEGDNHLFSVGLTDLDRDADGLLGAIRAVVADDHPAAHDARPAGAVARTVSSTTSGLRLKNSGIVTRCTNIRITPRMIITSAIAIGEPMPRNGLA